MGAFLSVLSLPFSPREPAWLTRLSGKWEENALKTRISSSALGDVLSTNSAFEEYCLLETGNQLLQENHFAESSLIFNLRENRIFRECPGKEVDLSSLIDRMIKMRAIPSEIEADWEQWITKGISFVQVWTEDRTDQNLIKNCFKILDWIHPSEFQCRFNSYPTLVLTRSSVASSLIMCT